MKNISLVLVLMLVSFSNAFSGSWKAGEYPVEIKYDDKTWALIDELDTKEDTYIALIDNKDGSSILFRIEHLQDALDYDYALLGEHLADGLRNSDPDLEIINTGYITISGNNYYSLLYKYNNKKFGLQYIRHAIKKMDGYIIMLTTSWPFKNELDDIAPIKIMSFLNGMRLGTK